MTSKKRPGARKKAPGSRSRKKQHIVLPKEALFVRLGDYYAKLLKEKQIKKARGHKWLKFTDTAGMGLERTIGFSLPLTEGNVEEILYHVGRAVHEIHVNHPKGRIYLTIHMYEYGKEIVGSPGPTWFEDDFGSFTETWQGIPGSSARQVMIRFRFLLERMADEKGAVFIGSVTVRSFEKYTPSGITKRGKGKK